MRQQAASQPDTAPRRDLHRAILLGIGAACLYGTWAFYTNAHGGVAAGLCAAATQACLSFTATVAQIVLLGALFRLGRTPAEGFVAAVVGGSMIGNGVSATAHLLAGTPHVLATIAPSMLTGLIVNALYARVLYGAATGAARTAAIPAGA